VQVAVAGGDRQARRAALRAGFRQEGIQRGALVGPDGTVDDRYLYARLATDRVGGPHGFSAVMNSALPRKRLIAHVLIRDDSNRVLLCETQFKTDWELPGGIVEPGEAPRLGAIREVLEELGVDRPIGRLLLADWMPPYLGWEDAIEMIFDGGRVTEDQLAGFVLQPSEIRRVQLCTLDEAAELVTPIAHRRLTLAAGLGPDEMAYTEDGARPAPARD
jgi:8-oxo-dGTP diphosphatase